MLRRIMFLTSAMTAFLIFSVAPPAEAQLEANVTRVADVELRSDLAVDRARLCQATAHNDQRKAARAKSDIAKDVRDYKETVGKSPKPTQPCQ